jgi:alanyl-tRNA synthetase
VPEGDSTTLFTGSGMQPMVPYLLGQKHPLGTRLADSQKSFRAEDIEEVGDNRHTTFFEMLGNWSLGDYWKKEQLNWLFEFLTKEVGLDPQRLYVSVFSGDEEFGIPEDSESAEIWLEIFKSAGIQTKYYAYGTLEKAAKCGIRDNERIFGYGVKKNWWSRSGVPQTMPVGEPGGPDSEIFYDFGTEHDPKYGKSCHINCDCGRFMEIGNSVFMEYVKTAQGFEKLKQRNVDFGGGLERITAASNGIPDVFEVDTLKPAMDRIDSLQSMKAQLDKEDAEQEWPVVPTYTRKSRTIADHVRAAVFLISDGVVPSNKDRGYVLRRLIRRSVRYGKQLGIKKEFLADIANAISGQYAASYPDLVSKREAIAAELAAEESKYYAVVEKGIKELIEKGQEKAKTSVATRFPPDDPRAVSKFTLNAITPKDAFDLYQTHGLHLDEINDYLAEYALYIDPEEFKLELKKHQDLSRTASAGQFKGGLASHSDKIIRLHTATHLLNAALRKVLGAEVWQKGSNITEERTRFDFTHNAKMTDEQKQEIEKLVNGWIDDDLPVKRETMSQEEARKLGAIGVFGEKYADEVSVYSIVDPKTGEAVSREFCGGPHVEHTRTIGKFRIQKEEAVSAGVRRIKAVIEP